MKNNFLFAATLVAGLAGAVSAPAGAVTLTFDELATQPVNGLTTNGVTFEFLVGNQTSADAVYNRPGPSGTSLLSGPVLEGDARGVLRMSFAAPASTVSFAVALTSPSSLSPGVAINLFESGSNAIRTQSLNTVGQGTLSAGRFDYTGALLNSISLDFNDALLSVPQRFALDNLTFLASPTIPGNGGGNGGGAGGGGAGGQVPEPGSIALLVLGVLAMTRVVKGRSLAATGGKPSS